MKTLTAAITAVAVIALLAGCGGSGKPAAGPTASPSQTQATTYPGEAASAIAASIKGCTDIEVGDIFNGGDSGMTSTATCAIGGRPVTINSYKTADDASLTSLLAANKQEMYYALGDTWNVVSAENPTLQLQITNNAGELTKEAMDEADGAS